MTPSAPLTLPCDYAILRADVTRLWPEAASACDVDPTTAHGSVYPHSEPPLVLYCSGGHEQGTARIAPAVEALARRLEDIGYVIDRRELPAWGRGVRHVVLGWAAHHFGRGRHREPAPTRLIDRAPWHPVVKAWRERLSDERAVRDAEEPPQ